MIYIDIDKLDIDKLVATSVDLSKLSDLVKNDVTNTTVNAKINEVKNEIPIITNLATTTALNAKTTHDKKLTITQKLVNSKIKFLLIMIMINILLLKNLIG